MLIIDRRRLYCKPCAVSDIKTVGVCRTIVVSIGVIDGDISHNQIGLPVNAEHLNRRVDILQILNGRRCQVMGEEKFWLGDTTIAAFIIPPTTTISIQGCTRGSTDCDVHS